MGSRWFPKMIQPEISHIVRIEQKKCGYAVLLSIYSAPGVPPFRNGIQNYLKELAMLQKVVKSQTRWDIPKWRLWSCSSAACRVERMGWWEASGVWDIISKFGQHSSMGAKMALCFLQRLSVGSMHKKREGGENTAVVGSILTSVAAALVTWNAVMSL